MKPAILFAILALSAIAADEPENAKLPTARADLASGKKLFENQCGLCHGPRGEGGRGPVLARPKLARAAADAALVRIIENGIPGTEMPGANAMSEREVRQTAAYVRSLGKLRPESVPGDAAAGAALYRGKGGCVGCHAINGDGGVSGPDLAGIGGKRNAAYLRESLLNPEAAVPNGYLLVTAVPPNAAGVTGSRVNEDSFSIQILDDAGRIHSFWKSDLAELKKQRGKSPMPSYKSSLTEAEITDLVAFLASLKEAK